MPMLKYPAVSIETGLSPSTIKRMVDRAEFTAPLQLTGQRSVGWPAEIIAAWIKARVEAAAA